MSSDTHYNRRYTKPKISIDFSSHIKLLPVEEGENVNSDWYLWI